MARRGQTEKRYIRRRSLPPHYRRRLPMLSVPYLDRLPKPHLFGGVDRRHKQAKFLPINKG